MGIVSGGSARFNGGTITTPLVIAPTADNATALTIQPTATAFDVRQIIVKDESGNVVFAPWTDGSFDVDALQGGGNTQFVIASGRVFKVVGASASPVIEANGNG